MEEYNLILLIYISNKLHNKKNFRFFLKKKYILLFIYRARSMYGYTDLFTKIRKNVRNWESVHPYMTILTHVRINVNPYMGIRTFYGDYCIKMAFFLPFFRIFFCFLPIFSKFSRFAQIYNIYSMISNEFLII